ncbi:hypothetical protein [Cellulomonas fimi]|uniref:Lipoprotein n=1 Tax=Cellulomonas fimi (strain ATCC 484 / DSM 20113 / JCM 1341 / CCUG 24087 / LMG 16345 / NBRC 15513 / NCIMB 8980 / NCTC 7547 / NRS-133) TaxID=590998 RepID=F4H8P1_CELFA|nr:hypothetical protein [Cellulomonas fimi]AEE47049.1 hypothetical protein Celf_2927 [Cellulomonas fimi ATCC 484]NNH07792.1 hypothetical protein [Cellulomonas fimi]VEH34961.1 Uncharacterised protein [Cellulomonas fimi]
MGRLTASVPRRRRVAHGVATLGLASLLLGCGADPLAGLGGPGLRTRCAEGLPEPTGTAVHACNDGEGRGTFPVELKAGRYDLVVLCDGADDVTVVLDPVAPASEPAVAECSSGPDPSAVEIGTLTDDEVTELTLTQHGEGDIAFFIVRR